MKKTKKLICAALAGAIMVSLAALLRSEIRGCEQYF